MENKYLTLGDVGRLLNSPIHKILYLISSRQIPEPQRIAGRRVWTLPELAIISEKLKIELGLKLARGEGDE